MTNVVRKLREAAGLSQAELARRSGVAQSNISAYESGRRRASDEVFERIRRATRPLPHAALQAHGDELRTLASRYGLTNVRVFDAAAREVDRADSDLDILVTRSPGIGLMSLADFVERASELLGVEVDLVTDGGLRVDHDILATAIAV